MEEFVTAVVVDDHPFFRDGIVRGLTMSGRVKVLGDAGDGREGLELIRAESPDVAVDAVFELHGFEPGDKVKREPQAPFFVGRLKPADARQLRLSADDAVRLGRAPVRGLCRPRCCGR